MRTEFDSHASWLFGAFRLVLADREAAGAATVDVLAEVSRRGEPSSRSALLEAAVARMAPFLDLPAREAAEWEDWAMAAPVQALPPVPAIDDEQLAFYVRSLPYPQRQAIALGPVLGLGPEHVASVLAVSPRALAAIQADGLEMLHERIVAHTAEAARQHDSAGSTAGHERVMAAVRGDRPAVPPRPRPIAEEPAPAGLAGLMFRLLVRLSRRWALATGPLDDRAGAPGRSAPLMPTPTARPLARPRPTPTTQPLTAPPPTAGTGVHRRSPQGTPSTSRLHNPRRPGL